jgi:2-keto-3-deoxy-L-rhamnonate aldolase RhmA
MFVVQIEDPEALDNIDALLASIPVDAVMPGLADLSTALGHPGDFAHPKVLAAAERLFTAVGKANLPLGLYVANSNQIERWRGVDAQFHVYAIDYKVMAEGYRAARVALSAGVKRADAA